MHTPICVHVCLGICVIEDTIVAIWRNFVHLCDRVSLWTVAHQLNLQVSSKGPSVSALLVLKLQPCTTTPRIFHSSRVQTKVLCLQAKHCTNPGNSSTPIIQI